MAHFPGAVAKSSSNSSSSSVAPHHFSFNGTFAVTRIATTRIKQLITVAAIVPNGARSEPFGTIAATVINCFILVVAILVTANVPLKLKWWGSIRRKKGVGR